MITDRAVDELAAAGLETLPSRLVKPPRVKGAPVHFECRYNRTVELKGNRPVSFHKVVFGEVIAVHIDDSVINEKGIVDILRMRPLSRLGYRDYTSVESIFQMDKHTPEEATTKNPAEKYSHVVGS
jgi:flavin reductase (DIM6/NTAB) family NADH-FMN oxidoreductase RutF